MVLRDMGILGLPCLHKKQLFVSSELSLLLLFPGFSIFLFLPSRPTISLSYDPCFFNLLLRTRSSFIFFQYSYVLTVLFLLFFI